MGAKKMYRLDLTRPKGRDDSEQDLMSCIEIQVKVIYKTYG
jgi:hypothetical protein